MYKFTTLAYRCIGLSCAGLLLFSCSDSGTSVQKIDGESQVGHSHTSGIDQGYWPPQPLDVTNEQPLPSSAKDGVRASVLDAARQRILSNPAVLSLLGDDYRIFDGSLSSDKEGETAKFVFYSYTSEQTVFAYMQPDGSVTTESLPAHEYQPPEHPEESTKAIELANAALSSAGFETSGLVGAGLLAHPSINEISASGNQFHEQRLIYVTFGEGDGALPVYRALVNVSDSVVLESGLVQ